MNDPLADLKDIHLPDAITWWPLAPGWWLLMLAIILLVAALTACYHFWKKRAYRRLALQELEEITANTDSTTNTDHYLETIAGLIRRTAIAGSTDKQIAHWQGSQWQEYLQQHMPEDQAQLIAVSRYQANHSVDKLQLANAARQWIKEHKA